MRLIKNARIITNRDKTEIVNLLFDDKIRQISPNSISETGHQITDLEGLILIPGCIDPHVHFNDPGFNHREDFLSGTQAAACGGITTIIDMPCTSDPPVVNRVNLKSKLSVIEPKAVVDFALWGGIRRNDLLTWDQALPELWGEGIVGFKIYTISGMDSFQDLSYAQIRQILTEFPKFLFAFHAEDKKIILDSTSRFSKKELEMPNTYPLTRPVKAELKAVKKIILGAHQYSRIHFVHISSREAAKLILKNKSKFDLTFETCPHYLQFTEADLNQLKGRIKTAPPVRSLEDRTFLRRALCQEKIDFVSTDHAGCNFNKEKNLTDFSQVYNGIPGIELMIPYLFSEFYLSGRITPDAFIRLTSENAARRFGLYPRKGSLQIGTDADFTIVDPESEFLVDEHKLHSLGKYSPLHGKKFRGKIAKTIVRGKTVYDEETCFIHPPGHGIWITRNN